MKLDNGKTVNLYDVQFSDRGAGVLYDYMSYLGTKEEMQSFLDNYSADQQAGRYANAFSEMYRSGALDTAQGKADFDKAYKALPESYKVMFGEDQLRSIYNSGANETSEQYIQDMENQRKTAAREGTGKLYIRDEEHNLQEIAGDNNSEAYMPLLRAYAATTKTDIIVADDLDDNINGMYDSAMQRIVLNANNEPALYSTVFHEGVGEVLQAYNAKGAQKERSVLLQYVADTKGKKYVQNIAQKYQNAYTPVEATKSVSDAMGEAVNDAIAGLFSSKEGIHDFNMWMQEKEGAGKAHSVLGTLSDHFKKVADSMRRLINRGGLSEASRRSALIAENNASKIRKMILDELDTAIENAQNAKVDENAKSGIVYSLSEQQKKALGDRVDDVLNNKSFESSAVLIMDTPEIFQSKLGFRKLPMVMTSEHVYADIVSKEQAVKEGRYHKGEHYHNLGKDGFIKAVDRLTEPAIIAKSRAEEANSDIVVYTNTVDKDGNPVIAAIRINKNAFLDGARVVSNDIGSIYGKSDNFYGFLEKQIDQNRILYVNKDQLKQVPGVQFPDKLLSIDPTFNLARYREVVNRKNRASQEYQKIEASAPDVKRFSIDVDHPVQQTKDLIAVHNLDEKKLLADIKELGGFPAPSMVYSLV